MCKENAAQYMCKWCNDYSINNNAPGRKAGGRPSGIFQNTRSARQHFNSHTHRVAATLVSPIDGNLVPVPTDINIQQSVTIDGDCVNDNSFNMGDNNGLEQFVSVNNENIDFINGCGFDKESKSPAYYAFVNANAGMGAQYLTAKAFSVAVKDVSLAEARFSLLMATLLCQLTRAQREVLAEILAYASTSSLGDKSIFNSTRVATTTKDFDDLYLTSPESILCNLPHPVAKCVPNKSHAYVTLTDVLANEMAACTSFDNFYFNANVKLEHLTDDPKTLSTTTSAYHLFFQ